MKRRWVPVFLALLVLGGAGAGPMAAPASALSGYFCGDPSAPRWINVGSRCTHTPQHYFQNLSSHENAPVSSDVMCVLAKANSDGSGGNTTPPACVQPLYAGNAVSYCTAGYSCVGYATIIHQAGGGGDYFYGYLNANW
jgi:hypothetical protein